jgi:GTPase
MQKKDQLKKNQFRKGMVLLDKALNPQSIWEFEAEVVILHHATTIQQHYQAVMHCGVIRQAAQVLEMNRDLLRTGDKGHIKFKFMYRPEYLKPGTTILFREGRTKGLGVVSGITLPTEGSGQGHPKKR